jgi:drug/metabolite transporter (DMT)-like permease
MQLPKGFIYEVQICIATILMGVSVVIGRQGMVSIEVPHTFNTCQQLIGLTLLLMIRFIFQEKKDPTEKELMRYRVKPKNAPSLLSRAMRLFGLGLICAIPCYMASSFNQVGLVSVDAGKSAFMTSLYVIFTPFIQYVIGISKGDVTIYTWGSAGMSVVGSYFLAGCSMNSLTYGEIWTLLGAVMYSFEILATDYSVGRMNSMDLTCIQMGLSSVMCICTCIFLEPDGFPQLIELTKTEGFYMIGLVLCGGSMEAVAYQLTNTAMVHVGSSRTALLMGLDVVVTAVAAYLYLGELLSRSEIIGCIFLLASSLLVSTTDDADIGTLVSHKMPPVVISYHTSEKVDVEEEEEYYTSRWDSIRPTMPTPPPMKHMWGRVSFSSAHTSLPSTTHDKNM